MVEKAHCILMRESINYHRLPATYSLLVYSHCFVKTDPKHSVAQTLERESEREKKRVVRLSAENVANAKDGILFNRRFFTHIRRFVIVVGPFQWLFRRQKKNLCVIFIV